MLEALFGATIVSADGRTVPVRLIGEQHVREDLGFIPSFADWALLIAPQAWMLKGHPLEEPNAVLVEQSVVGQVSSDARSSPAGGKSIRVEI